MKSKKTKLTDVMNVIEKWSKDNDVMFFGSFVSFDKEKIKKNLSDVIDEGTYMCFGDKKTLKISLDEFNKMFKKEKEEFINW